MRRIEHLFNLVGQSRWKAFFKADAANGYWAVPLAEKHAYKTAFTTSLGQYCYLRMGQGLTGAPGTYTRLKDLATGPIPSPHAEPALTDGVETGFGFFMDDDFGMATSSEELLKFLHERYFPRLAWAELTLNPKKTVVGCDNTQILGHDCTLTGIRPSIDKLEAVREWPIPTSESELMRFVYTLPFLRVYIPGRADLTAIMKEAIITIGKGKTKRVVDFRWGKPQQRAFDRVKKILLNIKLVGGDSKVQYHLATDASNCGLGGVLFQLEGHPVGTRASRSTLQDERVVMYLSFALTKTESNYHTTEKEALAVLRCVEECRWLIQGASHQTIVYTGHSALKWLLGPSDTADPTGRIARWQFRIQEYDLEFVHIAGKMQVVADGLSRTPSRFLNDVEEDDPFTVPIMGMEVNGPACLSLQSEQQMPRWERQLFSRYQYEEWYASIVDRLLRNEKTALDRRYHLRCEDGIGWLVYQEKRGMYSRCVRKDEVEEMLRILNDCHGHFASRITLARAIGRYYWPTRALDVNKHCMSCHDCQLMGPRIPRDPPRAIAVMEPMSMFAIDYIGPFNPRSSRGYKYILIGADYFSRFVFLRPTEDAVYAESFAFLRDDVSRFLGWPQVVYSDRGTNFTAKELQELTKPFGVKHIYGPSTSPWATGLAERVVRLVVNCLRRFRIQT
ncbi:hypothetical protein N7513_002075 [Penicillium frequentans]|nr:hypothetical protein N7513_002075 [Penicillium glabrum]